MRFYFPAFQYPPPRPDEGYWAPVTSTINWCEEDYYATLYSAEIVNSLTNVLFIALGIKGVRNCLKYKHDSVYLVAFIGYLLVGCGSLAFHNPMQLVDELSMIYTACLMCYATFSYAQSRLFRQVFGLGLLSLAVFITLYYHYLQDPVFHQDAFAIITTVVIFRSIYVMEVNIRPSFRERHSIISRKDSNHLTQADLANDTRDTYIINEMWLLIGVGLFIFLSGFGIWALDNKFCSTLRQWRYQMGLPWGILLEGHGWWHLMTGVGSYFHLVWGIWLRHCLNERQDEFVLKWPSILISLPEVVPLPVVQRKSVERNAVHATNCCNHGHARVESRKSE